jgi:dihydrofolate reductase
MSAGAGKLIFASNMSLDGFTETADGGFNWAPPNDDVFAATTDVMRSAGTYLYGRRMYEIMSPWETEPSLAAGSELRAEFARTWQAPAKVVYSTTLTDVATANTRIERDFDPRAVAALKRAADHDLLVGGPHLAAEAFKAGLVDECVLWVWPVILGGRNPALPTGVHAVLELVHERRFDNGVIELRYRVS